MQIAIVRYPRTAAQIRFMADKSGPAAAAMACGMTNPVNGVGSYKRLACITGTTVLRWPKESGRRSAPAPCAGLSNAS